MNAMSKTIEQIWGGNLDPIEFLWKSNNGLKQMEHALFRRLESLEKTLDSKQLGIYEKCVDDINQYIFETSKKSFCEGFSIGTRITAEAMLETEGIFGANS